MPRYKLPPCGLYVITPDPPSDQRIGLVARVAAAIRGGAAVVQYRAKQPAADSLCEATLLLSICHQAGVPLIINDDIDLAFTVGADGVHLGQQDKSLAIARQRLGPDAIVGVSCYDSASLARAAGHAGADYVAFGRFFPSSTKPQAPSAHFDTLREAKRTLQLPVVAIGGVTIRNARSLLAAGADLLAVIEGVFGREDPESAAQEFRNLWSSP